MALDTSLPSANQQSTANNKQYNTALTGTSTAGSSAVAKKEVPTTPGRAFAEAPRQIGTVIADTTKAPRAAPHHSTDTRLMPVLTGADLELTDADRKTDYPAILSKFKGQVLADLNRSKNFFESNGINTSARDTSTERAPADPHWYGDQHFRDTSEFQVSLRGLCVEEKRDQLAVFLMSCGIDPGRIDFYLSVLIPSDAKDPDDLRAREMAIHEVTKAAKETYATLIDHIKEVNGIDAKSDPQGKLYALAQNHDRLFDANLLKLGLTVEGHIRQTHAWNQKHELPDLSHEKAFKLALVSVAAGTGTAGHLADVKFKEIRSNARTAFIFEVANTVLHMSSAAAGAYKKMGMRNQTAEDYKTGPQAQPYKAPMDPVGPTVQRLDKNARSAPASRPATQPVPAAAQPPAAQPVPTSRPTSQPAPAAAQPPATQPAPAAQPTSQPAPTAAQPPATQPAPARQPARQRIPVEDRSEANQPASAPQVPGRSAGNVSPAPELPEGHTYLLQNTTGQDLAVTVQRPDGSTYLYPVSARGYEPLNPGDRPVPQPGLNFTPLRSPVVERDGQVPPTRTAAPWPNPSGPINPMFQRGGRAEPEGAQQATAGGPGQSAGRPARSTRSPEQRAAASNSGGPTPPRNAPAQGSGTEPTSDRGRGVRPAGDQVSGEPIDATDLVEILPDQPTAPVPAARAPRHEAVTRVIDAAEVARLRAGEGRSPAASAAAPPAARAQQPDPDVTSVIDPGVTRVIDPDILARFRGNEALVRPQGVQPTPLRAPVPSGRPPAPAAAAPRSAEATQAIPVPAVVNDGTTIPNSIQQRPSSGEATRVISSVGQQRQDEGSPVAAPAAAPRPGAPYMDPNDPFSPAPTNETLVLPQGVQPTLLRESVPRGGAPAPTAAAARPQRPRVVVPALSQAGQPPASRPPAAPRPDEATRVSSVPTVVDDGPTVPNPIQPPTSDVSPTRPVLNVAQRRADEISTRPILNVADLRLGEGPLRAPAQGSAPAAAPSPVPRPPRNPMQQGLPEDPNHPLQQQIRAAQAAMDQSGMPAAASRSGAPAAPAPIAQPDPGAQIPRTRLPGMPERHQDSPAPRPARQVPPAEALADTIPPRAPSAAPSATDARAARQESLTRVIDAAEVARLRGSEIGRASEAAAPATAARPPAGRPPASQDSPLPNEQTQVVIPGRQRRAGNEAPNVAPAAPVPAVPAAALRPLSVRGTALVEGMNMIPEGQIIRNTHPTENARFMVRTFKPDGSGRVSVSQMGVTLKPGERFVPEKNDSIEVSASPGGRLAMGTRSELADPESSQHIEVSPSVMARLNADGSIRDESAPRDRNPGTQPRIALGPEFEATPAIPRSEPTQLFDVLNVPQGRVVNPSDRSTDYVNNTNQPVMILLEPATANSNNMPAVMTIEPGRPFHLAPGRAAHFPEGMVRVTTPYTPVQGSAPASTPQGPAAAAPALPQGVRPVGRMAMPNAEPPPAPPLPQAGQPRAATPQAPASARPAPASTPSRTPGGAGSTGRAAPYQYGQPEPGFVKEFGQGPARLKNPGPSEQTIYVKNLDTEEVTPHKLPGRGTYDLMPNEALVRNPQPASRMNDFRVGERPTFSHEPSPRVEVYLPKK